MSVFKEHIKPILVLLVICLVVSAALAGVYTLTDPVIRAATEQKNDELRRRILPDATGFTEIAVDNPSIVSVHRDDGGSGFIVIVAAKGYGGTFEVTVGIAPDGRIIAVAAGANSETAGAGSRAADSVYTDRFAGTYSADETDALTGATFTSRAIKKAVATALALFDEQLKGGN